MYIVHNYIVKFYITTSALLEEKRGKISKLFQSNHLSFFINSSEFAINISTASHFVKCIIFVR